MRLDDGQPPEVEAMHQAVLQLPEGFWHTKRQQGFAFPTADVVAAIQRLVDVVNDLRSPDSGWGDGVPQTPEALIPYVTEEAYDALEALQRQFDTLTPETSPSNADQTKPEYMLLSQLSPWLLWCVARSAFEVMQLLEGVAAKRSEPGKGWQDGMLRLVAYFTLEAPDRPYLLDLTNYQAPENLLRSTDLIQSDDCTLCQANATVSALLQQLLPQIQATTPALQPFMEGIAVNVLAPQQDWQSSVLTLHLGFEFVVTKTDRPLVLEEGDDRHPADAIVDIEATAATVSERQGTTLLTQFTNADWLKQYTGLVIQQQLETVIPQLPAIAAIATTRENAAIPLLIAQLVEDACALDDHLQNSLTLASRNFPKRESTLDDLMLRLLWCFSRSTYEVMQLMSGIPVKLLQAESHWQTGLLRLSISLKVQTPEADWHLDLVTGQSPEPSPFPLKPSAIVQSDDHRWCQQLITVENLHTRLLQHTSSVSNEIQLLLDGAEVDLLEGDQQWQPGVIRLKADFEFVPMNFSYF